MVLQVKPVPDRRSVTPAGPEPHLSQADIQRLSSPPPSDSAGCSEDEGSGRAIKHLSRDLKFGTDLVLDLVKRAHHSLLIDNIPDHFPDDNDHANDARPEPDDDW
jgi:hypothetical protein